MKEMGSFRLQVNETNEKMSFKMGLNLPASFSMGKNILNVWYMYL